MDRRTFLTGVGTMGAAVAGGWSTVEASAGAERAATLEKAAGVARAGGGGKPGVSKGGGVAYEGLVLGYLPGSPALLELTARGETWDWHSAQTRWARWDPTLAFVTSEPMVSVSIGMIQRAQVPGTAETLRSLEVLAHFAIDEAPYVVPFQAWKYRAAADGSKGDQATSPLTFDASMHNRVGLQVNYRLNAAALVPNMLESGMLYLPLGARNGPSIGLHVLAGPSRLTGALPDLREYQFSGDLHAPLLRVAGGKPDFDYVTVMIRRSMA
jgi:hypothetical protein